MKRIFSLAILLLFSAVHICAQDWHKRAEENPLDCVFYLLSQKNEPSRFDIESLVRAYRKVGRLQDAARTIELSNDDEDKFVLYLRTAEDLAKEKQLDAAKAFLLKSFAAAKKSQSDYIEELSKLIVQLATFGFHQQASEIVENTNDTEHKLAILISLTDQYVKTGQVEKAQTFLPDILLTARTSEYVDYTAWGTAQAGLFYAKLDQPEKAIELLNQAKITAFSIQDGNQLRNKILWALLKGYTAANQPEIVVQIWQTHGEMENEFEIAEFEWLFKSHGYSKYLSSFVVPRQKSVTVETALAKGDFDKALEIAKSMSQNYDDYYQQSTLLKIADHYLKIGETETAADVMDFTFQRALKVDASEPESGSHSIGATAGSRKVGYLSEIAASYAKANRFDKALLAINAIHKPNIQAIALADLAERQIKTASANKIFAYLARALQIVRTAKETMLDKRKQAALTKIAAVYGGAGANEKALAVFAEVLQIAAEDFSDDDLLNIGIAFDELRIKPDKQIKKILRQIIENES